MADKYRYGWDAVNKKKVYMGKYSGANPRGQGYFEGNDAGNKRYKGGGSTPDKREFVGSGQRPFVFYSETNGTLTIMADSWEEAWRIAKSRGYSKTHYRGRE